MVGLIGGDIRRMRYCMSVMGLTVGCVLFVLTPVLRSDFDAFGWYINLFNSDFFVSWM